LLRAAEAAAAEALAAEAAAEAEAAEAEASKGKGKGKGKGKPPAGKGKGKGKGGKGDEDEEAPPEPAVDPSTIGVRRYQGGCLGEHGRVLVVDLVSVTISDPDIATGGSKNKAGLGTGNSSGAAAASTEAGGRDSAVVGLAAGSGSGSEPSVGPPSLATHATTQAALSAAESIGGLRSHGSDLFSSRRTALLCAPAVPQWPGDPEGTTPATAVGNALSSDSNGNSEKDEAPGYGRGGHDVEATRDGGTGLGEGGPGSKASISNVDVPSDEAKEAEPEAREQIVERQRELLGCKASSKWTDEEILNTRSNGEKEAPRGAVPALQWVVRSTGGCTPIGQMWLPRGTPAGQYVLRVRDVTPDLRYTYGRPSTVGIRVVVREGTAPGWGHQVEND